MPPGRLPHHRFLSDQGTPYYDEVRPKLVNIGAWRDSTDRDIAVRGRHSRRFYQFADELLKAETAPLFDMARIEAARAGSAVRRRSEVEA